MEECSSFVQLNKENKYKSIMDTMSQFVPKTLLLQHTTFRFMMQI